MACKSVQRPSEQNQVEGLLQRLALEKLTYVEKGKYITSVKIWRSFLEDDSVETL